MSLNNMIKLWTGLHEICFSTNCPSGFSKKSSDEIEESSDEIEELYRLQNEIDPLAWQGKYVQFCQVRAV